MNPADRIAESVLAEIRRALPMESVARRILPLKKTAGWWMACCPFHGEKTPSFGIKIGASRFKCFACGASGDIFDFVRLAEGCDFPQAVARCAADAGIRVELEPGERKPLPPLPPAEPSKPADRSRAVALARRWWWSARPFGEGAIPARYLEGRRLWPLPPGALAVMRETRLAHPDTGREIRHPVLLLRIDDPAGQLCAVHRIYLEAEGGRVGKLRGVNAKLAFGEIRAGAAIRLGQAEEIMGVAEGPETALAASLLSGVPVWSAVAAGILEKFQPPEPCRELWIFADRDKPRTGKAWRPEGQGVHSARVLAERMRERELAARIFEPRPPAEDFADVIAAEGDANP